MIFQLELCSNKYGYTAPKFEFALLPQASRGLCPLTVDKCLETIAAKNNSYAITLAGNVRSEVPREAFEWKVKKHVRKAVRGGWYFKRLCTCAESLPCMRIRRLLPQLW